MAYNCIHFSEHMKQIKMLLLSMSFGNTLLIAMFCECVCVCVFSVQRENKQN